MPAGRADDRPGTEQPRAGVGTAGERPRPGDVGTLRLADGAYAGHAHRDRLEQVLAGADGAVGEVLEVAVAARVVHQTARVGMHVVEPEQHEATLGIDDRRLVELADRHDDTAADTDVGVDAPVAVSTTRPPRSSDVVDWIPAPLGRRAHPTRSSFDKQAHVRERTEGLP